MKHGQTLRRYGEGQARLPGTNVPAERNAGKRTYALHLHRRRSKFYSSDASMLSRICVNDVAIPFTTEYNVVAS